MSWHLDRLEEAVLNGENETMEKYANGEIRFPYHEVVRIYLDSIGR